MIRHIQRKAQEKKLPAVIVTKDMAGHISTQHFWEASLIDLTDMSKRVLTITSPGYFRVEKIKPNQPYVFIGRRHNQFIRKQFTWDGKTTLIIVIDPSQE